MNVTITCRHCTIPGSVRRRAGEGMRRLTRFNHRLTAAEVTFDEEAGQLRVEAVLQVERAAPVVARAEGTGSREVLDALLTRLARQLKRDRQRRSGRRPRPKAKDDDSLTMAPSES